MSAARATPCTWRTHRTASQWLCSYLRCRVTPGNSSLPGPAGASSRHRVCIGAVRWRVFQDRTCSRKGTAGSLWHLTPSPIHTLLQGVSTMLGSPFPLPLDSFFSCRPDALPALRGALLPGGGGSSRGALSQLEMARSSGALGAPLSLTDRQFVQLRPLRPYCAGRTVYAPYPTLLECQMRLSLRVSPDLCSAWQESWWPTGRLDNKAMLVRVEEPWRTGWAACVTAEWLLIAVRLPARGSTRCSLRWSPDFTATSFPARSTPSGEHSAEAQHDRSQGNRSSVQPQDVCPALLRRPLGGLGSWFSDPQLVLSVADEDRLTFSVSAPPAFPAGNRGQATKTPTRKGKTAKPRR